MGAVDNAVSDAKGFVKRSGVGKILDPLNLTGVNNPNMPAPSDLVGAANATAAGNLAMAQNATVANRSNTSGPTGTSNWAKDPTTGQWTQTNALSAPLQSLANTAQSNLQTAQATPLTVGTLKSGVTGGKITGSTDNNANLINSNVGNNATQINTNLAANAGNLATNAGNPNLLNQQVSDALYKQQTQYLDPQFQQSQSNLENQLANQGITRGSEAWNREMLNANNQKQQAYSNASNSAIGAGVNAAQGMFGMNLQNANLNNSSIGQQFGQNATAQQANNAALGQQFNQGINQQQANNAALGQQFNQNLTANQFANQAQNQGFTQDMSNAQLNNAAAAQSLQGNMGIQNLYSNQLNGLYGMTPTGTQYNQSAVAGADLLGAAQGLNTYNQGMYNAQTSQANNLQSGMFLMAGAALPRLSDIRTKENIVKLGKKNGFNLYEFDYKDEFKKIAGFGRYIGVMADEVEKILPDAVVTYSDGYKRVNYAKLGFGMVEV